MTQDIQQKLQYYFGFRSFRPGQDEAIRNLLAKEHTLVVMPTGSGKSLIYQLTAMCLPHTHVTLVISPLIALMKDQVDSMEKYGIPATFINSMLTSAEQSQRLRLVAEGVFRLVYVAPERLRNTNFCNRLQWVHIGLLAIDEAHCISHWGHDFRPDYLRIAKARAERLNHPLTVALTATATKPVQDDILGSLNIPDAKRIVTGFNRPNLSFEVRYTSNCVAKQAMLKTLLKEHAHGTAIVYVGTRREAEEVARFIHDEVGIQTQYYHAGLQSSQRDDIQEKFIRGKLPVIVATNAFGMGIDRSDVRLVIHYNMPGSLEAYYQEAGRAGRDEGPARAVLFYDPQDRGLHQWFIDKNMVTTKDLYAIYRCIRTDGDTPISMANEYIANMTGLDVVNVKVGLSLLERAGIVEHLGDEGQVMQLHVHKWNKSAVHNIAKAVEEYHRHKQTQLDQMIIYAESSRCRRRIMLDYFSDYGPSEVEHCCDNCTAKNIPISDAQRNVADMTRAERAALIILDSLRRLKWGIGRKRLAELLKGSQSQNMTEAYQQHTYYGRFAEFSIRDIEGMIEQLITQSYLKISGNDKSTLRLSPQGEAALDTKSSIPLKLPDNSGNVPHKLPDNSDNAPQSHRPSVHRKNSTLQITAELYRQGYTPDEIAHQRGFVVRTIQNHLADLIGMGELQLTDVVAQEVIDQVRVAIEHVGDLSRLSPLKEVLPEQISYEEIRCVVESVKYEQRKQ